MRAPYPFFLLALSFLATACAPDAAPTPQSPPNATDFAPLSTGSYWVYQVRVTDLVTGTNRIQGGPLDSVWVAGQQTIRGLAYAEIKARSLCDCFSGLFRDSAGYLVNVHGRIQLAPTDRGRYLDTGYFLLPDSTYYARFQTTPQDTLISVPAVTTISRDWRGTRSISPICPTTATHRYMHAFHAPKIGLIKKTCYYCSGIRLDWELVRFRVAQAP